MKWRVKWRVNSDGDEYLIVVIGFIQSIAAPDGAPIVRDLFRYNARAIVCADVMAFEMRLIDREIQQNATL
jgi:hypothetical protein